MDQFSSAFDPNAFLQASTSEQGSIVSVPVPVGEYLAVISEVKARTWQSKDGTKNGIAIDLVYDIDDAKVKEFLGRTKVTITQGLMLDLTEQGGLDMGKGRNVQLNRVREATGLNVAGQPFAPNMFAGRVVKLSVGNRPSDRPQDPPGTLFSDVLGVARVS